MKPAGASSPTPQKSPRFESRDLFQSARVAEITHDGAID
jgi:hemin uptake protein HemP